MFSTLITKLLLNTAVDSSEEIATLLTKSNKSDLLSIISTLATTVEEYSPELLYHVEYVIHHAPPGHVRLTYGKDLRPINPLAASKRNWAAFFHYALKAVSTWSEADRVLFVEQTQKVLARNAIAAGEYHKQINSLA